MRFYGLVVIFSCYRGSCLYSSFLFDWFFNLLWLSLDWFFNHLMLSLDFSLNNRLWFLVLNLLRCLFYFFLRFTLHRSSHV